MRVSKPLFLLLAMLVSPAIGATAGVATRGAPVANSDSVDADVTVRGTTSRATASRAQSSTTNRTGGATRGTSGRSVASRSGTTDSGRGSATASRATTARTTSSSVVSATRNTQDINENPAVRRAGVVVRPAVADYGGRATIAGTGKQTGSNIRNDIQKLTNRAAEVAITQDTISAAKDTLDKTAEINASCQEQYNECMDQFCAVVDANQKRCSCSANLSRYSKVEAAVTEANEKLNEVAQTIRYVGLSADEIRAIMTETEAEQELSGNKDTSATRNMLDQIEKMIKDPTSTKSSYVSESNWGFGLDMDLDFTSDSSDIFNLDFLNGNNNTNISNMRGTELYSTAKKRCNTILTKCKSAGAIIDQVTGNYDLAIDRDCIAYEAGLKKMNTTLVSNVNNAKLLLQKARLAVMENKNQYDARGCLSALENCMKDDMVCGDDYSRCIDPTKSYIDENGEVVLGQDITRIQSFMVNYSNADISSTYLSEAYGSKTTDCATDGDGKCIVKYLLQKIGTKQKATDEGLCRPVLDKCQIYTYQNGKYRPYNDIVVNYIQRAMINIKSAQQQIISDYASTCMTDVASCYSQQVSQVNSWSTAANTSNKYAIMRGACRGVALTCGLAIFSGYPKIKENQTLEVGGATYNVSGCKISEPSDVGYNDGIIDCVSNIFYQALLCPENSHYESTGTYEGTVAANGTAGFVNARCMCDDGYVRWGDGCVVACPEGADRNSSGACICRNGMEYKNGFCYEGNQIYGNVNSGGSSTTCSVANSFPSQCTVGSNSDGDHQGCVAENCRCKNNYMLVGSSCVPTCTAGTYRASCTSVVNGKNGCAAKYCGCGANEIAENGVCESLSCPTNAELVDASVCSGETSGKNGCVKKYCQCKNGTIPEGGRCKTEGEYCPAGATYSEGASVQEGFKNGGVKTNCKCASNTISHEGSCVSESQFCPNGSYLESCGGAGNPELGACAGFHCKCNSDMYPTGNGACATDPCADVPGNADFDYNSCRDRASGDPLGTINGCVNNMCKCNMSGTPYVGNGACVASLCENTGGATTVKTSTCNAPTTNDGAKGGCLKANCQCPSSMYVSLTSGMCVSNVNDAIVAGLQASASGLNAQSTSVPGRVLAQTDNLYLQYTVPTTSTTGYTFESIVSGN